MVSDKRGIEQPSSSCDEKEGKKDYVYKKGKGRASSKAGALKNLPNHPRKGTSWLPGDRTSFIGLEVNTRTAMNETPKTGKNTDYLYAVVDKTKKKRKPPQVKYFTYPSKNCLHDYLLLRTSALFDLRKRS